MDKIKSSTRVYEIVLSLLHSLCTFIYILCNLWVYIKRRIVNCCHEVLPNEYRCVDSKFKGLNKVPHHLTIILGPEEPCYEDLVNIVVWCTASGVPYVSFYDHKGILKKSEEKFYQTLTERSGLTYNKGYWTKHEAPYNGYKRAFVRKIKIKVLSLTDGQCSVVETAKHFIKQKVNSNEITIDQVNKYLSDKLDDMPDPDLAVICGETCATYGFLPWHIRITEFVNLKSHHNIRLEEFISLLQFYCNCEQRFGK